MDPESAIYTLYPTPYTIMGAGNGSGVRHLYPTPYTLYPVWVQEMDPKSAIWKRIFKNPMAFAAFKSTEPWCAPRRLQTLAASARLFQVVSRFLVRCLWRFLVCYLRRLVEYMNLDLDQAIAAAGFLQPQVQQNSPRHKTVVAIKPST